MQQPHSNSSTSVNPAPGSLDVGVVSKPVELDLGVLDQVSGAGPYGGWTASKVVTPQGPYGGWS